MSRLVDLHKTIAGSSGHTTFQVPLFVIVLLFDRTLTNVGTKDDTKSIVRVSAKILLFV